MRLLIRAGVALALGGGGCLYLSSKGRSAVRCQSRLSLLPAARVAVVGAGVGGCSAAYFLREHGGEKLDLHVFQKPGSAVGGRTAVIDFCGHTYESGGSILHTSNKYMVDFAQQFGLECKGNIDEATTAVGIYNGRDFSFLMGQWKLLNGLKALWHYGFSIVRMNSLVTKTVKDFSTIYDLQGSDVSFLDVPSFLTATVGEQGCKLTLVSAETHLIEERGYSERLVREVVTAALRMNYGQNAGMNAFATLVALAGMKSGSLWNVVGGNKLIAEKLLEASKATLHHDEVTSITRTERDGKSIYTLKTLGNSEGAEYDSVIIACPLNTSSIEFERFPNPVNTKTATSPFQRTVANFIRGEIDPGFFGQAKDGFPLTILTTDLIGSPFEYRSVAVQIPSTVSARQVNEFKKSIVEDPVRTWKVFSPQPLTGEQLGQMFSKIDDVAAVDWLAYPVYNPPEEFSSFKLDDGVFYINAIEKAASAMEMSVIGAKNASLLTREYLLIRRDSV